MRTSFNVRGVLVVAAVTAGVGLLGMGSAVAAVPGEDGPVSPQAPYTTDGYPTGPGEANTDGYPADPEAPYAAAPGGGGSELLIGVEEMGRSFWLPSSTRAIVGLSHLPAIQQRIGLRHRMEGDAPSGDHPAQSGAIASDLPDTSDLASGPGATPDHPAMPIEPTLPASGADVAPSAQSTVTLPGNATGSGDIEMTTEIGQP